MAQRQTSARRKPKYRAEETPQTAEDILVWLALARFTGRPEIGSLSAALRRRILRFFGNYKQAILEADRLLFAAGDMAAVNRACRQSKVGRLSPDALYVHEAALRFLPPILRVYEGCARRYVRAIAGGNIIKLHRDRPLVCYLSCPDFDRTPHPVIAGELAVPLQTSGVVYHDHTKDEDQPVIYRKDELVPPGYRGRKKFAALSEQERDAGLFTDPRRIATQRALAATMAELGLKCKGHTLVRLRSRR